MTNKTVNTGAIVETNAFDANHRLTVRWTPAGGSQSYSYDAAGNNLQRSNPAVTNRFDALNRLTNMVDAVGTTQFSYTAGGDLASEVGPWATSTVSYSYHASVPHLRVGLSLQQPTGSWTNGVIQDRDGSNTPQVSYTRVADLGGGLESAGVFDGEARRLIDPPSAVEPAKRRTMSAAARALIGAAQLPASPGQHESPPTEPFTPRRS